MIYGSVCSGIEAASVAWESLGWTPAWFSEIEKFPCEVLKYRWPTISNLGDMTKLYENEIFRNQSIDLLVGGTPCQSFSVAGLRKGLDDPRGNLCLEFLRLVDIKRPRWFLWENVPGVLSSSGGRDFGSFLGAIQKLGYGFAYRILDAKYFGVPQRRRRVFVVGYLGDWRPAAAVLFERESLCGDTKKGRKKRKGITETTSESTVGCLQARDYKGVGNQFVNEGNDLPFVQTFDRQSSGEYGEDTVASTVSSRDYKSASDLICEKPTIAFNWMDNFSFRAEEEEETNPLRKSQTEAICFSAKDYGADAGGISPTLRAGSHTTSHANAGVMPAVAFDQYNYKINDTFGANTSGLGTAQHNTVMKNLQVRRLTPKECERLQGFPDDYTLLPGNKSDGHRYKALGNSMAVPCIKWLGKHIQMVDELLSK